MNQLDLMRRRRNVANLIRQSNRRPNCLVFGKNETRAHAQRKFDICHALKQQGVEFYTEAIFNNGLRADVLNADEGVIYEVTETEAEASIKAKALVYPFCIIRVPASIPWSMKLIQ